MPTPSDIRRLNASSRRLRRLRERRRLNRQRLEDMENKGETYLTSRERLEDMEDPDPEISSFGKKRKKIIQKAIKNPRKKVFQQNKNNFGEYSMNRPEQPTCGYGSRRRSRFGIHIDPGIPWENRIYLQDKFHEDRVAKNNYYENIYMNKPIHIKGTPASKRYTVIDFRMYRPVGDSLFFYYDENGEFKSVKASQVTGFDELPPPPEIDIFAFGARRRSRFGNNSNLDPDPEISAFGINRAKSDIIYLKALANN